MSESQVDGLFSVDGEQPPQEAPAEQNDEQEVEHDDVATGDDGGQDDVSHMDEQQPEPEQQQQTQQQSLEENFKRAIHQERQERARLQQQLQQQQQQYQAQQQQYQEQLRQFQQQQQNPPEDVPDPETDPFGYSQWQTRKLAEFVAKQQEWIENQENHRRQQIQAQQQQQRQQQALSQFVGTYEQHARQFMQQQPDFKDAYKFLQENRMKEYMTAGYDWNHAQRLMIDDEGAIVAQALQRGDNPAQRVYELAKLRGYQPGGNQPSQEQEQLRSLQQGLKQQGLRGGGGAVSTRRSADNVDTMSDSEFEKLWSDMERSSRAG